MRTFEQLRHWAKLRGYIVERISKNRIEWYRDVNHGLIGECKTIQQTIYEIESDYWAGSDFMNAMVEYKKENNV